MKKDSWLEEMLHDKLARTEVKPPADIWARLEAQLPEINREISFDGGHRPGPQESLPQPNIRKPLRRRMNWAYAAASVAVLGVILFTARNLGDVDVTVADNDPVEIPEKIIQPHVDPVHDGLHTDPKPTVSSVSASTSSSVSASHHFNGIITSPKEGDSGALVSVDTATSAGEQEKNIASGSDEKGDTPARKEPQQTGNQDNTDSFESFIARARAAENQRSRRNAPVSASLYAANTTGVTGSGTVTGRTKLLKSSLVVKETTDFPTDEMAAASTYSVREASLKHDLPLSFGASVNIGLTKKLSLETGLTYTFMRSKGQNLSNDQTATWTTVQKLHYLGIPVKVKYDFFQSRFIDLYASGGISVEKLLSGRFKQYDTYTDGYVFNEPINEKIKVGSLQTSVGANIGIEFNIDRNFGLYAEPGLGYFFENSNQPESYRTENALNFTIKAGFRIKL